MKLRLQPRLLIPNLVIFLLHPGSTGKYLESQLISQQFLLKNAFKFQIIYIGEHF